MHPVLRIAAAESKRHLKVFDRRVLLVALAIGLLMGLAWPAIQDQGVHPEQGLYVVGVADGSPLEPVLASDPSFLVHDLRHRDVPVEELDLLIQGQEVSYDPSQDKSVAALRQLQIATNRWTDAHMAEESDGGAAYPVRINVIYQTRTIVSTDGGPEPPQPSPPVPEPPATEDPANVTNATDGVDLAPGPNEPGLMEQQGARQVGLTPDELDPPFPLKSLLLTFAYLVPLTFVSELYSGSLFAEKVRSRGILLLSGPVTGGQVLLGKSLPYLGVMAAVAVGVTIVIGAGWMALLAVVPIVAFALSSSLFLSLLSRSQRALTFLLVSTNVGLSTFLFLPALFTQIEPVAFLSPVSVIAAGVRGDPVGLGPFLYATVPLAVAAATLTALSASFYKAENLFTPGGLMARLTDAVEGLVRTRWRFVLAGALAVPFAFGLELFVLVFAVTLDLDAAFVTFLLGSALVEELLKALPTYSHFRRNPRPWHSPWVVGPLVGLGFYLGEKGALAFTLFGFGLLPKGDAALLTFGIAATPLLVLAPLLLHMATATITAWHAKKGAKAWRWGLLAAVSLHAAYNLVVVQLGLGGGAP